MTDLGQIVEIGPTASVPRDPQHPCTRRLLASVPVADPSRSPIILDATEVPSPMRKLGDAPKHGRHIPVGLVHFVQASA